MTETEFSPSTLVEHPESDAAAQYSLIFDDFGPCGQVFDDRGSDGGGYAWHGAAVALVRIHAPELEDRVRYDPESSMFVAYGDDREALLRLAQLIRQVQTNHEMLEQALETINLNEYD